MGTGLLLLGLSVPLSSALASPITYQFNMPAFNTGPLDGELSILDVTVDNGSGSIVNQSYLNTEIIGLSATSGIYSVSLNILEHTEEHSGSKTYITTNSEGQATLDLTIAAFSKALLCFGTCFDSDTLQLGTKDGTGPVPYLMQVGTEQSSSYIFPLVVQGEAVPAVPVPAAAWLFGSALILLAGFNKRRKMV
jgi:hypothetical protein